MMQRNYASASELDGVAVSEGRFDHSMLLTKVQTMDEIVERAQSGTRFSGIWSTTDTRFG